MVQWEKEFVQCFQGGLEFAFVLRRLWDETAIMKELSELLPNYHLELERRGVGTIIRGERILHPNAFRAVIASKASAGRYQEAAFYDSIAEDLRECGGKCYEPNKYEGNGWIVFVVHGG